MPSFPKAFFDQANYREVAKFWLGSGTLVGALEGLVAANIFVWVFVMFRSDGMTTVQFVVTAVFFASPVLAPVLGWLLFARRWYWPAMAMGAFPIVIAMIVLTNFASR
jgi:hypothetical protein